MPGTKFIHRLLSFHSFPSPFPLLLPLLPLPLLQLPLPLLSLLLLPRAMSTKASVGVSPAVLACVVRVIS